MKMLKILKILMELILKILMKEKDGVLVMMKLYLKMMNSQYFLKGN